MTSDDLATVLDWRNHEDVRGHMFNTGLVAWDEHRQWFARASQDPRKCLLVFEIGGAPAGFVNLTRLAECDQIAEWGFYRAPQAARGTGRGLGKAALEYGFDRLGLHKIVGRVLAHNERSIRFHLALGFTQEGRLRSHHFDGARYHDIACFGLLSDDWRRSIATTPT